MAAFGSLQDLFEKPLPENPTLMESLSWNRIKAMKPPDAAAFTEIFGELHFEERGPAAVDPPSWLPALDPCLPLDGRTEDVANDTENPSTVSRMDAGGSSGECIPSLDSLLGRSNNKDASRPRGKSTYSTKGRAESLQLCTEGLGFESSDGVQDPGTESGREWGWRRKEMAEMGSDDGCTRTWSERRPTRIGDFPPPISCIGSRGKPWVRFRSYREEGRFVLREVRLPSQELLHAFRKDGRLKLRFVQPEEGVEEEEQGDGGGDEEETEGSVDDEEEEEEGEDTDVEVGSGGVD